MTKREFVELLEQVPDDAEVCVQDPWSGRPCEATGVEMVDGRWTVLSA